MKRVLAMLAITLVAAIAVCSTFTEVLGVALAMSGGDDELFITGSEFEMVMIPIKEDYISSGWIFGENTSTMRLIVGKRAMVFIQFTNNTGNRLTMNPNMIDVDRNFGEYFILANGQKEDYMVIEPFADKYAFLVLKDFSDYPIICMGRNYIQTPIFIDTSNSIIHSFIIEYFNSIY